MNEKNIHNSYLMFIDKLSKRIRSLRLEAGLTQDRVAGTARLAFNTYYKFERAQSRPGEPMNPQLHTLLAIADALYVPLVELLDVDNKHKKLYEKSLDEKLEGNPPNMSAEELSMALGKRIKDLRYSHDMTQEQVTFAAGVAKRTYCLLEKGSSRPGTPANPRLETMLRLADVFRIDLVELLDFSAPGAEAADNTAP